MPSFLLFPGFGALQANAPYLSEHMGAGVVGRIRRRQYAEKVMHNPVP